MMLVPGYGSHRSAEPPSQTVTTSSLATPHPVLLVQRHRAFLLCLGITASSPFLKHSAGPSSCFCCVLGHKIVANVLHFSWRDWIGESCQRA